MRSSVSARGDTRDLLYDAALRLGEVRLAGEHLAGIRLRVLKTAPEASLLREGASRRVNADSLHTSKKAPAPKSGGRESSGLAA